MEPDIPTDYSLLANHRCEFCQSPHRLAALPTTDGWDVGVRCRCTRNGMPVRYSTETSSFPTFQKAEAEIGNLLNAKPIRAAKNVFWNPTVNKWCVQVREQGRKKYLGVFVDHSDAVAARDAYLEAA